MADDIKSQISEAMKKVILTGVGAVFLTEESVRSYLGELKLPKELWGGFLDNAQKTKSEFLQAFAKETSQILSKIDVVKETKEFLDTRKIKVSFEVDFTKKD